MEAFELAILLTTAGAAVGAGLIKTLISALKGLGLINDFGRAPLYAAMIAAAGLMALAVWDSTLLTDGASGQDVFIIFLSWLGLYTSAVGIHETAVKAQRIVQGTTNPTGPDA